MSLVIKSNVMSLAAGFGNVRDSAYSASSLKAEYIEKVMLDGGVIVDDLFLTSLCNFLVTNNLVGKIHSIISASLGIKYNSSNQLQKMYNLIGDNHYTVLQQQLIGSVLSETTFTDRVPVFVAGTPTNRPYVVLNTSLSANFSNGSGNTLAQSGEYVSAGRAISCSMVCEPAFNTTSATELVLWGMGSPDTYNHVDYAKSSFKNPLGSGGDKNFILNRSYHYQNDNPLNTSGALYRTLTNTATAGISLETNNTPILKDRVSTFFTASNKKAKVTANFSNTNSAYKAVEQAEIELTKQFNAKRNVYIGSIGKALNASSVDVTPFFSNLKIYDFVLLRDCTEAQSDLVHGFIQNYLIDFYL